MIDLARVPGPLLGRTAVTNLAVGWNTGAQIGLATPFVIPGGGLSVQSAPFIVVGLNGFMLAATYTAPVAGGLWYVNLFHCRPNGTAWPLFVAMTAAIGAPAGGTELIPFGCHSYDNPPGGNPIEASYMIIKLSLDSDVTSPAIGISALTLFSNTRR